VIVAEFESWLFLSQMFVENFLSCAETQFHDTDGKLNHLQKRVFKRGVNALNVGLAYEST
jgi:hypothetical protein